MANKSHTIEIIIAAKNQTSTGIKDADKALTGIKSSIDGISSALGNVALSMGLAFGTSAMVNFVGDALQAAEAADRIAGGFETLAGIKADAMFGALRDAANGAIADADLMLAANRAMMLNVTNDADTMVKLLEVAASRGRAMGLSTAQAFDNIVTGIGRMSPLILDNLGILTGGEQAFSDYAKSIGKTADQLTDLEKREMLIKKVLQGWTEDTEVATTATEAWTVAWQNFLAAAGREIATGQIPGTQKTAAQTVQSYADYNNEIAEGNALVDQYSASLEKMGESGQVTQAQMEYLRNELSYLRSITGNIPLDELKTKLDALMYDQSGAGWDLGRMLFRGGNLGTQLAMQGAATGGAGWAEAYAQQVAQAQDAAVEFQKALAQIESQMTPERYSELSSRIMNLSEAYARGYISEAQFLERLRQLDPALAASVEATRELDAAITAATTAREAIVIEADTAAANSAMSNTEAQAEHMAGQVYTFYMRAEMLAGASVNAANGLDPRMADYGISSSAYAMRSTISNPDFDRSIQGYNTAAQSNAAAEARRNLNYEIADTSGKIAILRREQAAYNENSAEYINLETQIVRLQAQAAGSAESLADATAELSSMIDSILSPTAVTEADMAATRLGVYVDKWDEYARRLESAATDVNSEWKYLIPTDILAQGQDAIRLYVDEQKRLLNTGQFDQLVANGAPADVKEQSMQAIMGQLRQKIQEEAAMEAFKAEIIARAEAEGLTVTGADLAAVTGQPALATGADTASDFTSGVTQAITDSNLGDQLTTTFDTQLKATEERWIAFGTTTIGWFATGMKQGVNQDMITTLVTLLTPGVRDAILGRP